MKEYFERNEGEMLQIQIGESSKEIEEYFNSYEWQKQKMQIEAANNSIKYFETTKKQQQLKKIEKNTHGIQEYFNSIDWKRQYQAVNETSDSVSSSSSKNKDVGNSKRKLKNAVSSSKKIPNTKAFNSLQKNLNKMFNTLTTIVEQEK